MTATVSLPRSAAALVALPPKEVEMDREMQQAIPARQGSNTTAFFFVFSPFNGVGEKRERESIFHHPIFLQQLELGSSEVRSQELLLGYPPFPDISREPDQR